MNCCPAMKRKTSEPRPFGVMPLLSSPRGGLRPFKRPEPPDGGDRGNLLLRLLAFNTNLQEIHGFRLLSDIKPEDYKAFKPQGMTALYDAAYSGVSATLEMAKRLIQQDFEVNGCVYIITDGMDNASTMTPKAIADKIQDAVSGEEIESLITVLVGLINPNDKYAKDVRHALTTFQVEANLTQFVDAGDATAQRLAKLAQFVSQSISAQSQALGTGAPSQPLQF